MPNANYFPVCCRKMNYIPTSERKRFLRGVEVYLYTYYTYLGNSLKLERPSDLPKTVARYSATHIRCNVGT